MTCGLLLLFATIAVQSSMAQAVGPSVLELKPVTGIEGQDLFLEVQCISGSGSAFAVDIRTKDNSAVNRKDFELHTTHLSFSGTTGEQLYIRIELFTDDIVEDLEEFSVILVPRTGGVKVPDPVQIGIQNMGKATVSIRGDTVQEGDTATVVLTLDNQMAMPFEVNVVLGPSTGIINPKTGKCPPGKDRWDFDPNVLPVRFKGEKDERLTIKVPTYVDNRTSEGNEEITVSASLSVAHPDIDVRAPTKVFIMDQERCRHCPPTEFLLNTNPLDVLFYGDGSIQPTVEKGQDLPANTGLGVFMVKHFPNSPQQKFGWFYRIELEGHINVASTLDTVRAEMDPTDPNVVTNKPVFGNAVLTPANGKQSADIRLTLYNKDTWLGLVSGIGLRYTGVNQSWSIPGKTPQQVSVNMVRAFLFHEFINYAKRDDYSICLRMGYAYSSTDGDLGFLSNAPNLEQYLGSRQRDHGGIEAGFGFWLENLNADFSYTYLFPVLDHSDVPGLHGGRLIMTIRFVGGFRTGLSSSAKRGRSSAASGPSD